MEERLQIVKTCFTFNSKWIEIIDFIISPILNWDTKMPFPKCTVCQTGPKLGLHSLHIQTREPLVHAADVPGMTWETIKDLCCIKEMSWRCVYCEKIYIIEVILDIYNIANDLMCNNHRFFMRNVEKKLAFRSTVKAPSLVAESKAQVVEHGTLCPRKGANFYSFV